MTVNNKFKVGDKVYYIDHKKKAQCGQVTCVNVYVYEDHTTVSYWIGDSQTILNECEVFPTESDLKNYVFKDLIEFV